MQMHPHAKTGRAQQGHLRTEQGCEEAFQTKAAHVSMSASAKGGARFCEQRLSSHRRITRTLARDGRTHIVHTHHTHVHMTHAAKRADRDTHTCSHSAPMCSTRTWSAALNCAAVCASRTDLTHTFRSKDPTETDHGRKRTMKTRAQDSQRKEVGGEQLPCSSKSVGVAVACCNGKFSAKALQPCTKTTVAGPQKGRHSQTTAATTRPLSFARTCPGTRGRVRAHECLPASGRRA